METFLEFIDTNNEVNDVFNFQINDELLNNSKLITYNNNQKLKHESGKVFPYNPKRFPKKAIDIIFPHKQLLVELYFNTKYRIWQSVVKSNGEVKQLNEEQFNQFFDTSFYGKMLNKFKQIWPLKDKFYNMLYEGLKNKQFKIAHNKKSLIESNKKKDDKHSPSGRKYVRFSDMGVDSKSGKFYCWPEKGKEFSWSSWKNWWTQKPFCKMEFKYNNVNYGISLPLYDENYEYRGFRAYDLDWEPPLAWLSKEEFLTIPKLTMFQKFTKQCVKRVYKYIKMDNDEILKRINRPDKIEEKDVIKTKNIIKKVVDTAIRNNQFDMFKWRN